MDKLVRPSSPSHDLPGTPGLHALVEIGDDEFDLDIKLELPSFNDGSNQVRLGFPTNTCITCGGCTGHSCAPTSCCGSGTCLPTCSNCTAGSGCPTSCCTIDVTCGHDCRDSGVPACKHTSNCSNDPNCGP